MTPEEVLDIGQEAIFVLIKVALPLMLISLSVGLIIALFQALTQIQEMTLTFVPKIVAIFLSLLFLMPYMIETLQLFAESLSNRIVNIG
jgi:flagellar biosynthetic protein FliQ